MATVLLAKGARGEIVRRVQRGLQRLGFDPGIIDGDYGNKTQGAVSSFQRANGHASNGVVDIDTWERLTGVPPPGVRDRSLQLTAAFEGHDFTLAQGNFDGAGITWGIIGFTLKHGELSKIIIEIHELNPELVRQAFGAKSEELITIMTSSKTKQMAFADSISLGVNKVKLAEPWRSAFKRFGEIPEVQALQLELADRDYFQPALQTAREFNLKTELGISLTFDMHVQNGGIKTTAREEIARNLAENHVTSEQELRVIIAHAVADQARTEFREDVRSRKLTIATGSGKVHGAIFLLRNWGLGESPYAV
jgi:peptidoglycan hydrolase-like protein with peptidoglycan-binding domain